MEHLAVRLARQQEAPTIAALVRRAYSKYVERMGQEPAPMLADYASLIARGVVFVLPGVDGLRGLLVMWPEGDHLFLENIAVDPACQGAGLGRQLMQVVEMRARESGVAAVELYTNEAMSENLVFYSRLGFVELARRTDGGYRRVFMRKPLA